MTDRVALVMSTFNNADFIPTSLAGCLGQDYPDLVVIVADDGSTDDTVAVMNEIAAAHPNLYVLPLPHGERGVARIAAIDKARELGAVHVVVLDSDMVLSDGLVRDCVAYLDRHLEVGALVIPEIAFSDSTNFMSKVKVFERNILNNAGEDWGNRSIEAARFWRLAAYDSTGGFNPKQISFEEIQPTIRYAAAGGIVKRATFTGLRHDEKHVTLKNLLQKKKYYFSVMNDTLSSEKQGLRSALERFYFFRPVLYRPDNVGQYVRHPLLALGMGSMYVALTGLGVWEVARSKVGVRAK